MSTPLLVVVLVAVVLVVNLVVWGVVLTLIARRRGARTAEIDDELRTSGETAVLGPTRGNYCGGTGDYPKVANNSLLTVTATRLLVHPYFGRSVTIGLAELTDVRTARAWNGRIVGGRTFLVLATARGEVGLLVPDVDAWQAEIDRRRP